MNPKQKNRADAAQLYRQAERAVRAAGFGWEIEWQRSRALSAFTEADLLRETAWVIMCSGFRERAVRSCFDYISLCFCDWEGAREIRRHAAACVETAFGRFRNRRKLEAIVAVAEEIETHGFDALRADIMADAVATLQRFPFIGPVTSWHLAKNLGLDVAKNDRHLARLAGNLGFSDAQTLCHDIASQVAERISVVDLVLWRYATLTPMILRSR
jgi:hypothetical protein